MAAIDKIKKPTDVYIVVSTPLGFATKNSPNRVLMLTGATSSFRKELSCRVNRINGARHRVV